MNHAQKVNPQTATATKWIFALSLANSLLLSSCTRSIDTTATSDDKREAPTTQNKIDSALENSLHHGDTVTYKADVIIESAVNSEPSPYTAVADGVPVSRDRWNIQVKPTSVASGHLPADFQLASSDAFAGVQRLGEVWLINDMPDIHLGLQHTESPSCPPNAKCKLIYSRINKPTLAKGAVASFAIIKRGEDHFVVLYSL